MTVIASRRGLDELMPTLLAARRLAVDVESNGMHAYRQRVCTVQLAWETAAGVSAVVVDTLAVPVDALLAVLCHAGPPKVLHDLGFDARILAAEGVKLDRVSDTEVMGRMLGRERLGLATLLEEVGASVSKDLQQHDWARRPLTDAQVEYLVGDVKHLFALWDHLATEVREVGIEPEVEEETQHKLLSAYRPEVVRAPHTRIKGLDQEEPITQSVLYELLAEREQQASRLDRPPYKVANNDALLLVARRRPSDAASLAQIPGMQRAARPADPWLAAIARGVARGAMPADTGPREPAPSREERAARSRRESALRAFRKEMATARCVSEQVVLPGHCIEALAVRGPTTIEELREIGGLGALRVARDGLRLLGVLGGLVRLGQGSLTSASRHQRARVGLRPR